MYPGCCSIQQQLRAFGDFQLKAPTWTKDIVSNVSWLRTYLESGYKW